MKSLNNSSKIIGRSTLLSRLGKKVEENISKPIVIRIVCIIAIILAMSVLFVASLHCYPHRGVSWVDEQYLINQIQSAYNKVGVTMPN